MRGPELFVLLVCLVSGSLARLSITSATPSGSIFRSGESMRLECSTNNPWFLCIWETPHGLSCQCQLVGGQVTQSCSGDQRVTLSGSGNTCYLDINGAATMEDAGLYKCVLADQVDMQTVPRTIETLVGSESLVSWVGLQGAGLKTSSGEEVSFGCKALGGYPRPDIEVTGPNIRRGRLEDNQEPEGGYVQWVTYTANENDDGSQVDCIVLQGPESSPIYRNAIEAVMQIEAAEITGLAIPIGGIIGIILAILFIILLCALLAFFLLRRKKKDYKDNSQQVEIKETAKLNDYVVEEEITVTGVHKVEATPLLKSAPLIKVDGNTSTSNSKDKDQDININIINIIKKKDESKDSQREALIEEKVIIRDKPKSSSSSSSSSFSDTSSSSTSFYDAEYVGPRVVQQSPVPKDSPDSEIPSLNGTTRVDVNKHKLIDGQLVSMNGKSYVDIVGEHLHRNPSLETSKSSVELEQGMWNRSKTQKTEFYSSEKYEESKQYQSNLVKLTNGQNNRDKEFITNRPAYNPWSAEQEVRETKKQEQSYIVTSSHQHYQTEEMVQSSSAKTDVNQKNNFMSYVESAKLKDQHLKSDYNSRQKFDDVKVEVNGPVEFNPVARSTSTSSSSSSSSGIKESGHFTSRVSGSKVARHESDSSMSNEEIVRQHLNQFNEKEPKDGIAFNGIAVTAPGRARQYNTITEKYVNNAVRENDKTNVTVVNPINEEEIQDQHNIEHIKVRIDENRNNYMDGGPNIVESLRMEGKNEKRIVSHAEKLHEHFKSDDYMTAKAQDYHVSSKKETEFLQKTSSEKNIPSQKRLDDSTLGGQQIQIQADSGITEPSEAVRKKYIITQQEIQFYIKNADGTVKIVNRPLLTGENEYGSLTRKRRNSQPNLNQDLLECKSGVPGHIAGTGNINMEQQRITTVEQKKICVQSKEWRSSGSIFDCEQGCFSDNTVVI